MQKRLATSLLICARLFLMAACNKTSGTGSSTTSSSPATTSSEQPVNTAPPAEAATSSGAPANNGAANVDASTANGTPAASSTAPAPAPFVIPAGTSLVVTVDQDVSTKTNNSGDRFEASLAEPITVDGQVALPRHSRVVGTVTEADSAGHIKGGAVLAVTLDSVTVQGQKYSLETSSYAQETKGRGKRTAEGAGGGAAFGAIIGALAGGGKGAAIGALAGGGAGTAGTAFTGKRDITIPAETRLHFRLRRALTIPR